MAVGAGEAVIVLLPPNLNVQPDRSTASVKIRNQRILIRTPESLLMHQIVANGFFPAAVLKVYPALFSPSLQSLPHPAVKLIQPRGSI
jgi:hypothetical protein